MRLPLPISLSLLLLLTLPAVHAQQLTADDFFHGGAQSYISNNIPKALEVVTNGRALFPDDDKLKKLEELLKQQNQQQQQQQNDQKNQDEDKKDQDKKDQQQQDQKNQQQKDQQKEQPQKPQQTKPDKQKSGEQKETKPGQMTPAQAARLLDGQKGDEEALVFKPEGKPKDETKPVKDW